MLRGGHSQEALLPNTAPKSSGRGDPGVSCPSSPSMGDVSLHPFGVSSIFICLFLLPFPLAFQTWDTGGYYSFSGFWPVTQQRAAAFYQYHINAYLTIILITVFFFFLLRYQEPECNCSWAKAGFTALLQFRFVEASEYKYLALFCVAEKIIH